MRATVAALVYDRGLGLSRAARAALTTARLMQMQGKEADKLDTFVLFAHNMWFGPLNALWVAGLLLALLGWPALVRLALSSRILACAPTRRHGLSR